jgi:hypothetical protein
VRRPVEAVAHGAHILEISATRGEGISAWVDRLLGHGAPANATLDIDYDAYARGEAALAWLNATIEIRRADGLDPRSVGECLVEEIGGRAREAGLFVPHVKALVATTSGSARLALTRAEGPARWSGDPDLPPEAELSAIVNARAVTGPEALRALVEEAVAATSVRLDASVDVGRLECFSPPRPVPRHRIAGPASMRPEAVR